MGGSQAIGGVDSLMNYNYMMSDPYFQQAAMAYNPNFRASQQTDSASESQGAGQSTQTQESSNSNTASSVGSSGLASIDDSGSSITPYVVSGTVIAGGIAGLIYAGKRGNGEGVLAGIKNIWNGIFKKDGKAALEDGSEKLGNLLRKGGKNVQEFTVMKDGMQIIFKDGKPVKISLQGRQAINGEKAVEKWINKHPQAVQDVANASQFELIKPLEIGGKKYEILTEKGEITRVQVNEGSFVRELTKDEFDTFMKENGNLLKLNDNIALSWEREFTVGGKNYRFITENGQVTRVLREGKDGFKELEGQELKGFLENNKDKVKATETLQKELTLKDVQLEKNEDGVPTLTTLKDSSANVKLQVRNTQDGIKVVKASYVDASGDTIELNSEMRNKIQSQFAREIKKFSQEPAGRYTFSDGSAITDFSYARNFDVNGVKTKIRFNPDGEIIGIDTIIKKQEFTKTKAIEKFLEENEGIKEEVESLATGAIPEGYKVGEILVKSENGNVFKMIGDKITEIKLADGTVIKGSKNISKWNETAENQNETDKVLEMLKD